MFDGLFLNLNMFVEALDILNDGTLDQSTPNHNRSKREADEDLSNEERRVAGVRYLFELFYYFHTDVLKKNIFFKFLYQYVRNCNISFFK